MKEKKDLAILKAFVSLSLSFFFFLHCNPCFPLAYKRESKASHERDSTRINRIARQTHSQEETEPSAPVHFSHQRLGTCPSLDRLYPYYESFSANNTSNRLDIGTFCPNQYKPRVLLAHHPAQTRNNTNLFVGGNSKHR